jgi:hypothetical protein
MATTSLWPVKGYLGNLVVYIENPEKTNAPKTFEVEGMREPALQSLTDVIAYAARDDATIGRQLVSGVNCYPATARDEMLATKRHFGKEGGVIAYHGYQAFKPGEVSFEEAHLIGVELAQRCWGANYQILIATHVDKSHVHNHFLVNTVGFKDGKKFHRTKKDYAQMREVSDELCRDNGLSIISSPVAKGKDYGVWRAEREGRQSWLSIIKQDVDKAIAGANTDQQFAKNLLALGYDIKAGRDISVRPEGKERFVRLERNLGAEYSYQGICNHILTRKFPVEPMRRPRWSNGQPARSKAPKGSLLALYHHYLYLFGYYKKFEQSGNGRMHYLLREEIAKLDAVIADGKLLHYNSISDSHDMEVFKKAKQGELDDLIKERKPLYRSAIKATTPEAISETQQQIIKLNDKIKQLRQTIHQCERIERRNKDIEERIHKIEESCSVHSHPPRVIGEKDNSKMR